MQEKLRRQSLNFKLLGFDMSLHWSILLGMVFFAGVFSGWGSLFENRDDLYSNTPLISWLLGISIGILVYVSVAVHELAHALTARRLDLPVSGITIFILGGGTHVDLEHHPKATPISNLLVAAVGPISSAVLFLLFWQAARLVTPEESVSLFVFLLLIYTSYINILLAIFNAVPAYPLDGGRVFVEIIRMAVKNKDKAYEIGSFVGMIFTSLMIAAGIIWFGLILSIIGAMLLLQNIQERQNRLSMRNKDDGEKGKE